MTTTTQNQAIASARVLQRLLALEEARPTMNAPSLAASAEILQVAREAQEGRAA